MDFPLQHVSWVDTRVYSAVRFFLLDVVGAVLLVPVRRVWLQQACHEARAIDVVRCIKQ